MKPLLVFLIWFSSFFYGVAGESVLIDTVLFPSKNQSSVSKVPRVLTKDRSQNSITQQINAVILNRFMIHSFNPDEEKEFNWQDVNFSCEIRDSVLYISFEGVYLGTYTNDIYERLYFDLNSGKIIEEKILPFHSFFSLNGYFDFLHKYWLPECSKIHKHASVCAGFEPYCSCYDIDLGFNNNELALSLTSDCFFQVVKTCTPYYELHLPLDSVKQYLSAFGKEVLFNTSYTSSSPLDKFLFYRSNKDRIPDYHFFVGVTNHKESIMMALEFFPSERTIKGYYKYADQSAYVPLTGNSEGYTLILYEKLKGVLLNTFECAFQNSYTADGSVLRTKFLSATIKNSQTGKISDITWKEIRNNK